MPTEKSLELIENRDNKFSHNSKKDIHEKDPDYLKKSYEAAREVAKEYNWFEVNCVKNNQIRPIEDIHEEIYQEIKKHL